MSLALLKVFLFRKYLERGIMAANNAENMNRFKSDEKICRICGKDGDIAIFNYNAGKTIAEDINRCSDIMVSPNDGWPSFMCGDCHILLQCAVKFRKMCLESIAKLHGLRSKSVFVTLVPKEEVLSDYGDSECNDAEHSPPAADTPSPLAAGAPQVADSDDFFADIIPNCITCQRDFLSITEYRKHLPNCSKALLKGKGVRGNTNKLKFGKTTKGVFLCEVCGKTLTQLGSYLTHKSTHSNVFPFKCEQCAYRGKTKDLLRTHLRSHLRVKPYVCEVCSVTCSTSSNLAKHRRTHETHEPQRCPQCDKMFSRKERLARHIADIHTGSQPVDCDICGKRFLRRKGLVKHRLKQHKLRTPRGGRLPAYLLARDSSPPSPTDAPSTHREANADTAGPNSTIWLSQAGSKSESPTYGTNAHVNGSDAVQ